MQCKSTAASLALDSSSKPGCEHSEEANSSLREVQARLAYEKAHGHRSNPSMPKPSWGQLHLAGSAQRP